MMLRSKYEIDEIPGITNLVTNTILSAKINQVKKKIHSITNKIPNTSNLIKKTDYDTKISKIENKLATDHNHDKCINTQDFNKLTSEIFTARLAKSSLASKRDIANFVKKTDFDDKLKNMNKNVISRKTKHAIIEDELNELSEKVKAISTKDLINKFSFLNGVKYISSAIFKYYLVFIPAKKLD